MSVFLTLDQRAEGRRPGRSGAEVVGMVVHGRTQFQFALAAAADELRVEPSWGYWVGLAGLVLTGTALAAAGRGGDRER